MPWKVQQNGEDHCVVVSEGPKKGSVVKCHPTREAALAQVKALYANTSEGGAKKKKDPSAPSY
jgi:hypothetical protein